MNELQFNTLSLLFSKRIQLSENQSPGTVYLSGKLAGLSALQAPSDMAGLYQLAEPKLSQDFRSLNNQVTSNTLYTQKVFTNDCTKKVFSFFIPAIRKCWGKKGFSKAVCNH